MTGRELYERFVDAYGGGTNSKAYYDLMNPAQRRGWERLAEQLYAEQRDLVADVVARREATR
jgi:hypothetical protein